VEQALSVGIFPYMLKLLQTPLANLKRVLVRIWARIIAHDPSVKNDLGNAKAFSYFSKQLDASDPEHSVRAAVVLAISCRKDQACQARFFSTDIDHACLNLLPEIVTISETESENETSSHTSESDAGEPMPSPPSARRLPLVRSGLLTKWACVVLANMWDGFEPARFVILT